MTQPQPATMRLDTWQGLLRLSWVALVVNSLWSFGWVLVFTWRLVYSPPPRLLAGLATANIAPDLYFWVNSASIISLFLSYFVCALLLFIRRPKDRMAWFVAVFLMAFGTANAYPPAPEFLVNWTSAPPYILIPYFINNFLAWPLLVAFFALYPDGIFVPTWTRYVALYCIFFSLAWGFFPQAFVTPSGWPAAVILSSITLIFSACLYAQVVRYRRHATPLQRQQIKWMVYSIAIIVPITLTLQIAGTLLQPYTKLTPANSVLWDLASSVANIVFALMPIAVGIAILRHRLWDIDVIIRRTLVYTMLSALLVLVYFGSVVIFQPVVHAMTGQGQSPLVTVGSTLVIAALFNPLRHRAQAAIDHRFYRRRYDAERVLAAFSTTVRNETNLDQLSDRLVTVAQETMQPAHINIWLKPTGGHRP